MNKEKIPLFTIFKQDGQIKTETTDDCNNYELFGFLKCFVKNYEDGLREELQPRTDDDNIYD